MSGKKRSSTLLIDEQPLQVLPSLACHVGINAAILLQQINYWIKHAERSDDRRKFKANRWWTYNSYGQWREQMPWLSESGIRKLVKKLEDEQYIKTVKHNKAKTDHTKWYTINYDKLETLGHTDPPESDRSNRPHGTDLDVSESDSSITESPDAHSENSRKGAGAPADVMNNPGDYFARLLKTAGKEPTDRERQRCFVHMKQLIDKQDATREEMEKIAAKGFEAHLMGYEWWPKDILSKLRNNNVTPLRAHRTNPEAEQRASTAGYRQF